MHDGLTYRSGTTGMDEKCGLVAAGPIRAARAHSALHCRVTTAACSTAVVVRTIVPCSRSCAASHRRAVGGPWLPG